MTTRGGRWALAKAAHVPTDATPPTSRTKPRLEIISPPCPGKPRPERIGQPAPADLRQLRHRDRKVQARMCLAASKSARPMSALPLSARPSPDPAPRITKHGESALGREYG